MRNLVRVFLMTLVLLAGVAGIGLAAPHHAAAGSGCTAGVTNPWASVGGGVYGKGSFNCSYYGGDTWITVRVFYAVGGNPNSWRESGECTADYANYYSHSLACWVPAGYSTYFQTEVAVEDRYYNTSYGWSGTPWINVG